MKKALLIFLIIATPLLTVAQSSPVNRIFDKYSGKEGYTSVVVTKAMFDLFQTVSNDGSDKDFKDITARLNSIKILTMETKDNANTGNEFYKEMIRAFAMPDYQDLMTVNDAGEEVKFLIRKKGDEIVELVMVVGGTDPCLIAMDGDINLKQVSKLSKSMNIKGFDHLNNVSAKTGK